MLAWIRTCQSCAITTTWSALNRLALCWPSMPSLPPPQLRLWHNIRCARARTRKRGRSYGPFLVKLRTRGATSQACSRGRAALLKLQRRSAATASETSSQAQPQSNQARPLCQRRSAQPRKMSCCKLACISCAHFLIRFLLSGAASSKT